MTDVDGILRTRNDPKSLISTITTQQTERLIKSGKIAGGMIPKVRACMEALKGGVQRVHILNGNKEHTLLLELFTKRGAGTLITLGDG